MEYHYFSIDSQNTYMFEFQKNEPELAVLQTIRSLAEWSIEHFVNTLDTTKA